MTVLGLSKKTCRRSTSVRGLSVAVLLLGLGIRASAASDDLKIGSSSSYDPALKESVVTERLDSSHLSLGKGDWVVSGPLVDGLRQRRPTGDRSLGKRILALPIIRLFVPKPSPPPSDREVYFVGGESSRPWASISSEARRFGSPDNRLHQEGGCCLISLSR